MLTKYQLALIGFMSALLFSACSTSGGGVAEFDKDKAKVEIQAMEDAFAAGEKAKDAGKVMAYYSSDAVSYGRDKPPAVGAEAIKQQIIAGLAKDTSGNTNVYKVVDLFGAGNMLVEIGSWTEMDASGKDVKRGHYMSYFEKRDGKYVCVRDMNVSSEPKK